ncbi:SRPBCC family protein [Plantactinospora sp. S1510]|uniref:SRPBCC family protein n=1 Tax=Plantactinospora alkalitolerans TaxID=2789879 RepID=A0ABS0H3H6_9ACTN|nr:SRPBCC family protein [Plantactinospora alkalitolerans]MBF9133009.1 SRPBCC family protein [Plantactinospora alkalitolerans]
MTVRHEDPALAEPFRPGGEPVRSVAEPGGPAQATEAEIIAILVRHCGLDAGAATAAPTASLEQLGMDSLALLELQAVVADRYRVQLPEEAGQFSIEEISDLVVRQSAAEAGAAGPQDGRPAGGDGRPAGGDGRPGHTENSVVIAAPPQLVWERTNDVASWTGLFTEYQSVQILEQQGDTVRFRLTMYPDENGVTWSWVSERTADPARREVHAHRVETGPFEHMRIHWRYDEVPGGTRMTWTQDFEMRPTAPVTTAQMTDRINTNSRVQLDLIRDKLERIAAELAAGALPEQSVGMSAGSPAAGPVGTAAVTVGSGDE